MKKLLVILIVLLIGNTQLKASHILGGEITWECITSGTNAGKFIFTFKLYRACYLGAAGLGGTQTMSNPLYGTYGGASTFTLTRTTTSGTDLSPKCYNPSLQLSCGIPIANGGDRAMDEHVYVSPPVQINGTPPATGAIFSWSSCCRPTLLNSPSFNYWLRAVMFPYTDPATNTVLSMGTTAGGPSCYDSSPRFAERPATIICSGYPFTYNHNAVDGELDSLHYEWTNPMQTSTNGILWKPGYSMTSQLPGTYHSALNVPATIHPQTGEIKFTTIVTPGDGYHSTAVKVSSYKCRQKVAEIYRDIPVIIVSCPPTTTIPPLNNLPPNVTFKWAPNDPIAITLPAGDTVYAGDKVEFYITSTDIQFLPGFIGQTNYLKPSGSQFGNFFADTVNGCKYPPCATLDTTSVFYNSDSVWWEGQYGIATRFDWHTSCNHLAQVNACFTKSNTYSFVFKVLDNWCPAPGMNFQTFAVTVLAPPALEPPQIKCAQILPSGDVHLKWTQPVTKAEDTLSSFRKYIVHRSDSGGFGPGVVYDTLRVVKNIDSLEYIDVNPQISQSAKYYFVRGISSCNDQGDAILGDTISAMRLTATAFFGGNRMALDWNDYNPGNRWGAKTTGEYYVWMILNGDTTIIDTTVESWDTLDINLCYPSYVEYMVTVVDTSSPWGCTSNSSIDGDSVGDNIPPDPVVLDSVSYNQNNEIELGWTKSSPDIGMYYIYKGTFPTYTLIDSVSGLLNTYTYVLQAGDPKDITFSMQARDTCGNRNSNGPEQQAMGNSIVDLIMCDTIKKAVLNWNLYVPNWPGGAQYLRIFRSANGGPYVMIDSVPSQTVAYNDTSIQQNTFYSYRIRSWENGMNRGAWSSWDTVRVGKFIKGSVMDSPDLRCISWVNDSTLKLDWNAPFIQDSNLNNIHIWYSTGGPFTLLDSISGTKTSDNQAWYTTTFNHVNVDTGDIHKYYLVSASGCDGQQMASQSRTMSAIILNVAETSDSTNQLTWNKASSTQLTPTYKVFRDGPTNQIAAPAYGTEVTNDKLVICEKDVTYYVSYDDGLIGCSSISKVVDGHFEDNTPPAKQFLDSVSMRKDTTFTGMVGWSKNVSKDVVKYYPMYCVQGSYKILDTIAATSPLFYEDLNGAPLNEITQYSVVGVDSCNNTTLASLNFDCHSTMKLDAKMDFCDQSIRLNWNEYTDFISGQPVEYRITVSVNGGMYNEIGRTSEPKFKYKDIVNGNDYCFNVQAWDNSGAGPFSSSTAVECVKAVFIDKPEFAYMRYVTVKDSTIRLKMKIDLESNIGEYWVRRSTERDKNYKIIATIPVPNPLTPADSNFTYQDFDVKTDQLSYYYKIDVVDPCGSVGITSNLGRSIVLDVRADNEKNRNVLTFNPYEEWEGGVNEYEVYRGYNDAPGTMKLIRSLIVKDFPTDETVSQKGDEITFVDDVSSEANSGNGTFCYYVAAKEGSSTFPGVTAPEVSKSNIACTIQYPLFYVPTAFTPNGDGLNDRFLPLGAFHDIKSYQLDIYNRWGERIFSDDKYKGDEAGWDGTYNGKEVPSGVYVYIVSYKAADGTEYKKEGTVTVTK